ncbi:4472_t:CDS:2, partial [Funneliformis geosporum]
QSVKTTPEEIEAVQVFSKQLVEDYNYPKVHIQTRPQFRVKRRPSDTKKEYPVDIAVFPNNKKQEDEVYILVECKKKNRKDGKTQLQDYLTFSKAVLGVWFNGNERMFLRKIYIGRFKKNALKPTRNLKAIFKAIRNYLAANAIGVTRDEFLAQQLINLIFCKIYDEKYTEPENTVDFRAGIDESHKDVKKRVLELFEKVKKDDDDILDKNDDITLDADSVAYVVGELQNYCLMEAERDVIADAFEIFIAGALKGGQGQFFTPRNVVKMIVDILDPGDKDLIIDPACGSGGFLIDALKHIWRKIREKGKIFNWNDLEVKKQEIKAASNCLMGMDKDYFLSKVAKAYMSDNNHSKELWVFLRLCYFPRSLIFSEYAKTIFATRIRSGIASTTFHNFLLIYFVVAWNVARFTDYSATLTFSGTVRTVVFSTTPTSWGSGCRSIIFF